MTWIFYPMTCPKRHVATSFLDPIPTDDTLCFSNDRELLEEAKSQLYGQMETECMLIPG